jgi:hypothetical protein
VLLLWLLLLLMLMMTMTASTDKQWGAAVGCSWRTRSVVKVRLRAIHSWSGL